MIAFKVIFFAAFVVTAMVVAQKQSQQDLEASDGNLVAYYGALGRLGYGGYGGYGFGGHGRFGIGHGVGYGRGYGLYGR